MANNIDSIKNVGEENNPASNQSLPRLWNANYIKVWSANFMIFFSFMLVMPLLPLYLSEQYGAGKHTIGLILSGYTITALIARLFSGYVVDSFPRRTVLLLSYSLFSAQVRKSVDSPPGMLTEDHHHTVHEERQVCYSSHLRPKSLHL